MNKKTIREVDLGNKRILVRVDFNVPIEDGVITDDTRIQASLPTIRYILEQDAVAILCSHLGRPKGKIVPELSLKPVVGRLEALLQRSVVFVPDCVGPAVQNALAEHSEGDLFLLENTRFHPGETANDPSFAAELAAVGDIFVNDAFGSAHRAHASTVGVTHHLPAVAGFLMEKELDYLGMVLSEPERPFIAIIGGAKISDKIGVLQNLLERSDRLLIGGAMANTFLAADGLDMGESLVEEEALELALELRAGAADVIVLPVDLVVADTFSEQASHKIVSVGKVPPGWRAMDIGPETIEIFRSTLKGAQLVVWNGPMGVFEFRPFANGTMKLAEAVATCGARTIVGGGDSVAAVKLAGVENRISHVSTGGGASLEFLEGKTLPGVAVLDERG